MLDQVDGTSLTDNLKMYKFILIITFLYIIEDVSLVEFMYPVFIACIELS